MLGNRSYRRWLYTRVLALTVNAFFCVAVVFVAWAYLAASLGLIHNLNSIHLPGPFAVLWRIFLSDQGAWAAVITGGLSLLATRVQAVYTSPLDKDRQRMKPLQAKFGRHGGRLIYGGLSLSYWALGAVVVSALLGFKAALWLLTALYHFQAVDTVKTVAYAWLQQLPGAVLYALQIGLLFGVADEEEREKNRKGLQNVLDKDPRPGVLFGPPLRLSQQFYLKWVPIIQGVSLLLFLAFGALLMMGFASGHTPASWKISFVFIASIVAGSLVGGLGWWLTALIKWNSLFGKRHLTFARWKLTCDFPRSRRDWWVVNKATFASMLVSLPGGLVSQVAGLMITLLSRGLSEEAHQGFYVFGSHLVGGALGVLQAYIIGSQTSVSQTSVKK